MAQYPSRFPAQLDTFANHGSKDGIGLDIDWQKSDEFPSNELDMITDAILELERAVGIGGLGIHEIWDENLDTGIQTQKAAGEDILRFDTAGVERMTIGATGTITMPFLLSVTGGQILFPAGQVPSADVNTLDDYEEGTWTAAMAASTSGTITLNANTCRYTKIGRVVLVEGYFTVSAVNLPVGVPSITGFPFAIGTRSSFALWGDGLVAGVGTLVGDLNAAATSVNIYGYSDGTITAGIAAKFQAATVIWFSGSYSI